MLELKLDPVGWWMEPVMVIVIRFISTALACQCLLFLLKAVVLIVEVFYQGFYRGRSGIWTANILDWDWWGKDSRNPIRNAQRIAHKSSSFRISRRHESDPVLSDHRELVQPGPLVFRTQG
jgi:hypothetical protein